MSDAVISADARNPAGAAPPLVPVLELRRVNAAYGPFRALFDVSLTVGEGETVALLGRNGAGKTTVARVASGLVTPTSGEVMVDGNDVTGVRAHRYVRNGVVHVPEGRAVFPDFTVEENLTLAFARSRDRTGVRDALGRAFELFPPIAQRRRQIAGTLSGGEQRMLAMARVLVETPRLLIADELSLGLAPIVTDEVYAVLARIRDAGTALLIVEQHVGHALSLCERAILLDHGAITWQGPAADAITAAGSTLFDGGGK
ncbi:ABC transporter ATP-binding protein [Candidatus Poriferisocius sp.]|uniref:ABC transporter ATP-binding protein n=1 Tax=Candidatus Poriferisocius sp. TaxID=3101276 RepID=UPI003B5BA221